MELKENVELYKTKLKKISVALDRMQKEMCALSECTDIWKTLLSLEWSQEEQRKLEARYNAAMTPAHFAAYLLDPKYSGAGLTEEEDTTAMEFIDSHSPQAMRDVLAYRAKTFPFKEYLFKDDLLKITHVYLWWKSFGSKIDNSTTILTTQLFSATASLAGIERLFSLFGLVHSKVRNHLGTEKHRTQIL